MHANKALRLTQQQADAKKEGQGLSLQYNNHLAPRALPISIELLVVDPNHLGINFLRLMTTECVVVLWSKLRLVLDSVHRTK